MPIGGSGESQEETSRESGGACVREEMPGDFKPLPCETRDSPFPKGMEKALQTTTAVNGLGIKDVEESLEVRARNGMWSKWQAKLSWPIRLRAVQRYRAGAVEADVVEIHHA